MTTDRCPGCAGSRIRRSASFVKHLFRLVFDRGRRYCLDCKKRWRLS